MMKRGTRAVYSMLGLVALGFMSAASANAQVTVTTVKVTVAGSGVNSAHTAVYCDIQHVATCGVGAVGVWDLTAAGITLQPTQTLILTQTAKIAAGGNFDTSERVSANTTNLFSCTAADPCTVTVEINGQVIYGPSSVGDPLNFYNVDTGNQTTNEAHNWVLAGTAPTYTLKLGYADNEHLAGCPGGVPANCFPIPFTATVFKGNPITEAAPCGSNCWDSGALLITALATPFSGCTVTQGGWGSTPHGNNPGAFLAANFPAGGVTIGSGFPNPTGPPFWLRFTSAGAVKNFLPQGGTPGPLTASALNPTTGTAAGVFAGQVLALALNVQLKNFGSAVLIGTGTSFDGQTVAQVLAAVNLALSGGALPAGFTYSSLNDLVDKLNNSFDGCTATAWATAHLR